MKLNLSWRQKLLALIVVTPVGLVCIAGAVLWGLENVTSAYQSIQTVNEYENAASNLVTRWNAVEKDLGALRQDNTEAASKALKDLSSRAEQLGRQAQLLDDDKIAGYANRILADINQYADARNQWIQQMARLGFSDQAGLRSELQATISKLQDISQTLFDKYSLRALDEPLNEIEKTNRAYIADHNPDAAKPARDAVAGLEALIKDYKWQDQDAGISTRSYRERFDQADQVVQSIIGAKQTAQQAGASLQASIAEQSEVLHAGLIAKANQQAKSAGVSAKIVSLGAIALFGPLLILVLYLISRTLVSRLDAVVAVLSRVSGGDLTPKLSLGMNPRDEFNVLGQATNQMVDNIGKQMQVSINGTESLLEVHGELDKTMTRLVQNSETVESQTTQAATASQQISVTLTDVAQRTSQVGVSTQAANESAQEGARVVEASVDSMRRLASVIQDTHQHVVKLNEATTNVTGIIDVINSLADQTNLLALNAAIEAARAGEAGRGFSVVADEVRTLAQKTVAATTNIVTIIDDLKQQTQSMDRLATDGIQVAREGEENASRIAGAVGGVSRSIETLNAEMDQVVVAVEEISVSTEEIAQKMEDIRGQSAETHAIGEELGRQNERLSEQAGVIAESTHQFQVQ